MIEVVKDAPALPARWPKGLTEPKIMDAVDKAEEIPSAWPDDEDYAMAPQVEAIGNVLIKHSHEHLSSARIIYVFREQIKQRGDPVLGKMGKAGGKLRFLAECDFVLETNWSEYSKLSYHARAAYIDHELEHATLEVDEKGSRWSLKNHDLEEFRCIVERWGLWDERSRAFASTVHQLELALG